MIGRNDMAVKLTTYDPAEDLASDAAIATFMAEALATRDPGYIAHALGVVARAKGMAQIAEQTDAVRTLILAHAFSNVELIKRG